MVVATREASSAGASRATTARHLSVIHGSYTPPVHRWSPALVIILALAACSPPAGVPSAFTPPESRTEPSFPSETPRASGPSDPPASTSTPAPQATPAAWRELGPPNGPSPREDHTWTVDAAGERAYLFGGRDGATIHGDLWVYDLATDTWAEADDGAAPDPRFGHEAAWVDGIGLVVFAGQAGPTFFNDLWAFDPDAGTWSRLEARGAIPKERYGSCAAIGPDGRLWISHGFTSDGTRFADTIAYDFRTATWTDETPEGDLPVNRCLQGCWWTDEGQFALYGGQTTGVTALGDRWVLSDAGWTRVDGVAPPDRNLYARARVPGATLVVGGQAVDGGFLSDAWLLFDGTAEARELPISGAAPAGRAGAELIADPDRDRLLLFGGRNADGGLADLWELSGDLPSP